MMKFVNLLFKEAAHLADSALPTEELRARARHYVLSAEAMSLRTTSSPYLIKARKLGAVYAHAVQLRESNVVHINQ